MSADPQGFTYAPLPSKRHIRVLELVEAEKGSASLYAKLWNVDLDDEDRFTYVALSYTWGPHNFSEKLNIDGAELRITPNLASALQCFGSLSSWKRIWVDAVCIHQSNDVEKSSQIPLMTDIYRGASRVMVWLGGQQGDIRLLRAIVSASRQVNAGVAKLNHEQLELLKQQLTQLTQFPWFKRRWIIQELILNPTVSFCCGHIELSWLRLIEAINVCGSLSPQTPSIRDISRLWELWSSQNLPGQPKIRSKQPILRLLGNFHEFGCFDDRDRVSALLSLASDIGSGIGSLIIRFSTDYTLTTEEFYSSFAVAMISAEGLVATLENALLRPVSKHGVLPSWAPDWRVPLAWQPNQTQSDYLEIGKYPQRASMNKSPAADYFTLTTDLVCTYVLKNDGNHKSTKSGFLKFHTSPRKQADMRQIFQESRHSLRKQITPLKVIWASTSWKGRGDWPSWVATELIALSKFIACTLQDRKCSQVYAKRWRSVIHAALFCFTSGKHEKSLPYVHSNSAQFFQDIQCPWPESPANPAKLLEAVSNAVRKPYLEYLPLPEWSRNIFLCSFDLVRDSPGFPFFVGTQASIEPLVEIQEGDDIVLIQASRTQTEMSRTKPTINFVVRKERVQATPPLALTSAENQDAADAETYVYRVISRSQLFSSGLPVKRSESVGAPRLLSSDLIKKLSIDLDIIVTEESSDLPLV
jgi:Heterokaryon incompatibility protein (HET)